MSFSCIWVSLSVSLKDMESKVKEEQHEKDENLIYKN